ncbi:MAG: GtrA family protein [Lentisphaeria bacterium]|nr:GtrA family protein [Lentisphaeria bacterium]
MLLETFFSWNFIKKGLKFCITSLTACLLNFGINIIGHEFFGISVNILYPISLVVVSLSTFLQCRFFVYPGASRRNGLKQGSQFVLSSLVFRFLEWSLFVILYDVVALDFHWWYVFCILIVQTIGTISKFFFYNFFIFGHGNDVPAPEDNGDVK